MRDTPAPSSLTRYTVENPIPELEHLHEMMSRYYEATLLLARNTTATQRYNAQLKEWFDALRRNYLAISNMTENNIAVTASQIQTFRNQMTDASNQFAHAVYTLVLKHANDADARAVALQYLEERMSQTEHQLKTLMEEIAKQKSFNTDVERWATARDAQIEDLLIRKYVHHEELHARDQRFLGFLEGYTARVLAATGVRTSTQKVLESISRGSTQDPLSPKTKPTRSTKVKAPPTSSAPKDLATFKP